MRVFSINRYKIFIFLCLVFVCFFYTIVYYFFYTKMLVKFIYPNAGFLPVDKNKIFYNHQYITATYSLCSGLGNQMYRFASLYGIGQKIDRLPYFDSRKTCQVEYMDEIKEIFPNFYNHTKFLAPLENQKTSVKFGLSCCKYEDPNSLSQITSKYLVLDGNYFQSYKYFDVYKEKIKEFFHCSQNLLEKAKIIYEKIEGSRNSSSHNLCVHIRRGDFIDHGFAESEEDFTLASVYYALNNIRKNFIDLNITTIFIGNDRPFVLKIVEKIKTKIYIHEARSRGEDICLGIHYCNSLILTAGASTFGWWIGYLKKRKGPVFYNTKMISTSKHVDKEIYASDGFPSDWIGLTMNGSFNNMDRDSSSSDSNGYVPMDPRGNIMPRNTNNTNGNNSTTPYTGPGSYFRYNYPTPPSSDQEH